MDEAREMAVKDAIDQWESRSERSSWAAHQVREELVSSVAIKMREILAGFPFFCCHAF